MRYISDLALEGYQANQIHIKNMSLHPKLHKLSLQLILQFTMNANGTTNIRTQATKIGQGKSPSRTHIKRPRTTHPRATVITTEASRKLGSISCPPISFSNFCRMIFIASQISMMPLVHWICWLDLESFACPR